MKYLLMRSVNINKIDQQESNEDNDGNSIKHVSTRVNWSYLRLVNTQRLPTLSFRIQKVLRITRIKFQSDLNERYIGTVVEQKRNFPLTLVRMRVLNWVFVTLAFSIEFRSLPYTLYCPCRIYYVYTNRRWSAL